MESAIASTMDVTERQRESSHHARKGPKGKVARALELLERWGGAKQDKTPTDWRAAGKDGVFGQARACRRRGS